MGQVLSVLRFYPSDCRKFPKELRLQILEHVIEDCKPRPETLDEFEDASNAVPSFIVALRGHHDRELYFEALELFFKLKRFQLNGRNAYGWKIREYILPKVQKLELLVRECIGRSYGGQILTYRHVDDFVNAADVQIRFKKFARVSEVELMQAIVCTKRINRFIILKPHFPFRTPSSFHGCEALQLNNWFKLRGRVLWTDKCGESALIWEHEDGSHLAIPDVLFGSICNREKYWETHTHLP